MNPLKLPLACLLIISTALAIPVVGQKRRGPDKPAVKTPAAPAPAPVTLDTLLAADSYKVYGEVRGVGQLVRSNAATEILEPIMKLGGPPQDFVDAITWLKSHADELMTSRMVIAAWPTFKEVPEAVIAIEMPTAEDATKFESQLNGVLKNLLPPVTPVSTPETPPPGLTPEEFAEAKKRAESAVKDKPKEPTTPVPRYFIQRVNSLIVLTPKPVELKKLRPKGSKLFSEDANFRVAYNRFSSEPIFVFVNVNAIQKESEERMKQYEEEQKKAEEERKAAEEKAAAEGEKGNKEGEEEPGEEEAMPEEVGEMEEAMPEEIPTVVEPPKEPTEAEILSNALNSLRYSLMSGGVPDIPDAVGIGFSPENESFDLRVLLVDAPGEHSDPIPIFSGLTLGDQISPESPKVLPADSELVLTMALDLEMIYARMSLMEQTDDSISVVTNSTEIPAPQPAFGGAPPEIVSPLKTVERLLKIKVQEELLPLLGSEIAVSMPVADFNPFGPPRSYSAPKKEEGEQEKPAPRTPFMVISLRDKEGMRRMMPRILEGFAGKAAAALAQTERREDTELVSFGGAFAYAFVGNFLVLASDVATTRHVVDSYLKGETLAADSQFRNYTRWQPRQLHGQVYISQAMAESYRTWANSPNSQISDEARNVLTRLSSAPQPITYSLSNDGLGALHELHVPKSFLLLTVAAMASSANPPETVKNERAAMSTLWQVANAQRNYKEQNGTRYGSLEELVTAELLEENAFKSEHYKFAMTVTSDGFEISATPTEYGKTGKLSLFLDQSGIVRGGDHGGAAASASDDPISGY